MRTVTGEKGGGVVLKNTGLTLEGAAEVKSGRGHLKVFTNDKLYLIKARGVVDTGLSKASGHIC